MKKSAISLLATFVTLSACGDEEIASRYLATADITAAAGGTLVVRPEDSATLGGTTFVLPAGAVSEDITIHLLPGADLQLDDSEESLAGPAADLGPDGLSFAVPGTLTLPITTLPTDEEEIRVHVEELDGTRSVIAAENVTVDADAMTISFPVSHFSNHQPGRRRRRPPSVGCSVDSDCSQGEWCVRNVCIVPQTGQCRTTADCTGNDTCIQAVCTAPTTGCAYAISRNALAFGNVQVGSTSTLTLSISANRATTITAAAIQPPTVWSVSASLPMQLAAGATGSIDVVYSPNAAGADTGSLILADATRSCGSTSVPTTGTGVTNPASITCQSNADCPNNMQCVRGVCM